MPRFVWILLVIGLLGGVHHVFSMRQSWSGKREAAVITDANDPRSRTGQRGIVMLKAEWCGYCNKLRAELDRKSVQYTMLDVDTDEGDRALRALEGQGVPVLVVGQDVIQGYDESSVQELLAPLGYQVF